MKAFLHRILPVLMCLVLVFMFMASPMIATPAEAVAITASTGTIALIMSILAMLGITFASIPAAEQASQALYASWDDGSSAKEFVDNVVELNSGGPELEPPESPASQLGLDAAATAGFIAVVESIRDFFSAEQGAGEAGLPSYMTGLYGNVHVCYLESFDSAQECFQYSPYSMANYWGPDNTFNMMCNGVLFDYFLHSTVTSLADVRSVYMYRHAVENANLITNRRNFTNSDRGLRLSIGSAYEDVHHVDDVRFGFRYQFHSNGTSLYLTPYISIRYVLTSAEIRYKYIDISVIGSNCIPINQEDVIPDIIEAPYTNVTEFPWNDIIELITEYTSQGQELTFDYQSTLDALINQNEQLLQNQRDLLEQNEQLIDALQRLNPDPGTNPDPGGETDPDNPPQPDGDGDLDVPEMPALYDKFPFCIPFDLIHLIQALNATPEAPRWVIPFQIPSIGINEEFVLDLTPYETISAVIRWTTLISFVFFLIIVTRKLIKG